MARSHVSLRKAFDRDWLWPNEDRFAWKSLQDEWPGIEELIEAHAKGGSVAVQAGGCAGMYPSLLAKYFRQVYTFEPAHTNFYCLVFNCQDQTVIPFNCALGNGGDPLCLALAWGGNIGGWTALRENDGACPVLDGVMKSVPQLRLDDLHLNRCDAIFLDVEGYETEAIEGAAETIKRCSPSLIMLETVSAATRALLESEGYTLQPKTAADFHFIKI